MLDGDERKLYALSGRRHDGLLMHTSQLTFSFKLLLLSKEVDGKMLQLKVALVGDAHRQWIEPLLTMPVICMSQSPTRAARPSPPARRCLPRRAAAACAAAACDAARACPAAQGQLVEAAARAAAAPPPAAPAAAATSSEEDDARAAATSWPSSEALSAQTTEAVRPH